MRKITTRIGFPGRNMTGKGFDAKRRLVIAPLLLILVVVMGYGSEMSKKVNAFQGAPNVEELVRQSKFIFRGTVRQLGASTIPNIPVSQDLVIVRVDEIYVGPPSLNGFTSKDITVRLKQTPPVTVGQRWVFFTVGWLFGKSIAVIEVGRIEFNDDTAGVIRQQIAAAVQSISDQELQKRLARAELVVLGKVSSIRPQSGTEQADRGTEHDPNLREAVIQVESVEKGQLPSPTVSALFANSIDVQWFTSPKFREGQEGIFILFRNEIDGLPIEGLTALDSQDVLPRSELERVRRLLRVPGPGIK